ncbi:hypothetical protein [Cellvibrio sp. PSBB023]|uniref:hypothetical protein n=1 Tax=Cellvibrio sp. PSBB023 TaxID=1945512 RepID=UPI00098EF126|nr:hypothetical protein [Cellvibrio sp. PSBB023]AQT58708.1 hypothetical protein B0D95_00325 [Cellvibrio sp. PSBB023]
MLLKKIILGCLLLCAACLFGYMRGVADAKEKHLSDEITSLNNSLGDLAKQTKKAGELNLKLSKTIADRQRADDQSTQVFTHALAATSHLRFNCVFDDNIMQQLHQSADRADQATTSGIAYPLRSGDPPAR